MPLAPSLPALFHLSAIVEKSGLSFAVFVEIIGEKLYCENNIFPPFACS
jgi:hypothetical protein